jgi:hypothetical protein
LAALLAMTLYLKLAELAGAAPIAPSFAPNRNREKETATSVSSRSANQKICHGESK